MVYFISDIHLGSGVIDNPQEHQERLIALLKKMQSDADAIYLLGDVFDYWYEYFWPNERHFARYNRVLDALQEATQHCPVHFFIGNHDMWTWGWLANRTGMQVHLKPEIHTIAGKQCYLAHGDGLGTKDPMFRLLRSIFHSPVLRVLFRCMPPAIGDLIGYTWATASRRKEMKNPIGYLGEHDEELIRFARDYEQQSAANPQEFPHVDAFIFGHRHIELSFMLPSRACVYILGDYFKQFTYAQMDEHGNLSIELDEKE